MPDSYLRSLPCPLPEDIARLKGAGEYQTALELIESRLQGELPGMLRARLETERLFLQRLPAYYPLSKAALAREIADCVPGFEENEIDGFLRRGLLDFICLNGETRFHEDTCASLLKACHALNARAIKPYPEQKPALDAVIARVKQGGKGLRFRLRATLTISEGAFSPDETYRVHLPVPAASMQQTPALDVASAPAFASLDAPDAAQRTAYFEVRMAQNAPLTLEYSYEQRPVYVNPMDASARGVVYPGARPVCGEDLQEEAPHLTFSPYLRALAAELRGEESDPVRMARAFYDFITKRVIYAYVRPYLLIEGGAEYTAVNLRGDCGLQALLFIALCRISGIPARWQSGLYAAPGDVGSHDWAEFYSARLGWLPVDCSFGGTAYRTGAQARWAYYFGNLDPWRMVANRAYYAPFAPQKRFARFDPYDSQRGEVETARRGLIYGRDYRTRYEMLACEEIK